VIVLVAVAAAVAIAVYLHGAPDSDELALYGNVELRQVSVAFNASERISEILVEEGDVVRKGQAIARLDTSRLSPQAAMAEAQMAAQSAALERLRNGSRPEEIAQARASLQAAKAEAINAGRQYERAKALQAVSAVSRQAADDARAAAEVAKARVVVEQRALELAIAGPRAEDIAQAEAQLRMTQAQLDLLRRQLADAELAAPVDGVVRSRLMEPGEMASTTRPVVSIAVSDPKWIRAYVSEPNLGRVRPGMPATVVTDSFPDRPLRGRVGFISPVAEFTPRTVQTEDLRTSLVYEIRILVDDPEDLLRLGMPATVALQEVTPATAVHGTETGS